MTSLVQVAAAALDRALAARPKLDGEALGEATRALCAYRDVLRSQVRPGAGEAEPHARLRSVNGLVTLVQAGRYPLDAPPWDLLIQARDQLEALGGEPAATCAGPAR